MTVVVSLWIILRAVTKYRCWEKIHWKVFQIQIQLLCHKCISNINAKYSKTILFQIQIQNTELKMYLEIQKYFLSPCPVLEISDSKVGGRIGTENFQPLFCKSEVGGERVGTENFQPIFLHIGHFSPPCPALDNISMPVSLNCILYFKYRNRKTKYFKNKYKILKS